MNERAAFALILRLESALGAAEQTIAAQAEEIATLKKPKSRRKPPNG